MTKTKIALITDRDGWAFANIAKQIKKHLADNFDIRIVSFHDCSKNADKLHERIKDCDILHFFWRENIPSIPLNRYKDKVLSTAVYDHLFLGERSIRKRENIFNHFHYYVCSEKLNDIYKQIDAYPDPLMVIEDGIDPDLFFPQNTERFKRLEGPLKIGWVGNSKWSISIEDFKGFRTFVKPAVKDLADEGYLVEGKYADRVRKMIPHEEMVHYYATIDVLICMSKIEGTPNPILEAMACGVPFISTDVGVVPQAAGKKQNEFILKNRDKESLREAILLLYNNREKLHDLSQENLTQISNWHWSKQCQKFKAYFNHLIRENMKDD